MYYDDIVREGKESKEVERMEIKGKERKGKQYIDMGKHIIHF